jgi:hypothetical protein
MVLGEPSWLKTNLKNPWILGSYLHMLSFMFGRALLRSTIFSTAQKLSTRAVLSNQCFALSGRNFMTTASNRVSEFTTTSEPEPESKSKSKSARRKKTGSSTKASGKGNGKGKKATKRRAKVEIKKKGMPVPLLSTLTPVFNVYDPLMPVVIRSQDKPPKSPATPYTLWLTDWYREQPKVESREDAQSMVKKGAQVWHTVSEYEKQVCIQIHLVFPRSKRQDSDTKKNMQACEQIIRSVARSGVHKWTLASCVR